jgi:hypothetical protein
MMLRRHKVEQRHADAERLVPGNSFPQLFKASQQKSRTAGFMERDIVRPAAHIAHPPEMHGEPAAIVVLVP